MKSKEMLSESARAYWESIFVLDNPPLDVEDVEMIYKALLAAESEIRELSEVPSSDRDDIYSLTEEIKEKDAQIHALTQERDKYRSKYLHGHYDDFGNYLYE